MGRRSNNPELVQELINNKWNDTFGADEYTEKFNSLSSSDKSEVSAAIDNMESEFMEDESDEDDEGETEYINIYDAAQIWASHGKDEDYTFGYSEQELENAL